MGDMIGRYQLERLIGRGAFASVYLASDPVLGRKVAIKIVPLSEEEDVEYIAKRIEREAFAAGKLQHPSLVMTYEAGREKDSAYLVMQYVEGRTLELALRERAELSRVQVVRILMDISDALDYAHSQGIIHRDVKPANIMLDAVSGRPLLMDFGIARISASHRTTQRGTILGTVGYMAPEQIENRLVDGRADQFSLAIVGYELLTGQLPFSSESVAALMQAILTQRPLAPSSLNNTLREDVDAVLSRALSKLPHERFATCSEFATALVAACNMNSEWRALSRKPGQQALRTSGAPTISGNGAPTFADSGPMTGAIRDLPPLSGTTSISFTATRFFAGDKVRFDKIEESLRFYRENLKTEYQRLSNQADMTYKLWIACVGLGFLLLMLGIGLMFFADLARGAVTAASTVLIYFIQRVFQHREDAYRKAASEKSRHLQYGNQWLLVIQSIDAIEDSAERVRRQTALVDVLTSCLQGDPGVADAAVAGKSKRSRRAAGSKA